MGHEHQRKDRDESVTINWWNIEDDAKKNYEKLEELDSNFRSYDYHSIMHYGTSPTKTVCVKKGSCPWYHLWCPGWDHCDRWEDRDYKMTTKPDGRFDGYIGR